MKHHLQIVALVLLAVAASSFPQGLPCGAARATAAEPDVTRIVLIAGEPSHPSGQHEFNAGAILLARAMNEQSGLPVHVDVVHNGWPEDETILDGAAALVIYADGNDRHPTFGHEETVDRLIDSGVGLMCMHYAVEVPAGPRGRFFQKWIGGHYEAGFSCNPHWTADATPAKNHPVSRGVPAFSSNDEWYYRMRWAEPKAAVDLLTSTPTREKINRYIHWTPAGEEALSSRQTLMWAVERPDGGRGVGFTGGHWHRNWAVNDFRRIVLNAIAWTAKIDVPAGGVPSEPITELQLNENLDPKKTMVRVALPSDDDLTQPAAEPVEFRWPGKVN